MRNIFKAIGSILLGLVVVCAILFAFSPVGDWICGGTGEEDCGTTWPFLGFVGVSATFISLCVLAGFFLVGEFTRDQVQKSQWAYNRWMRRRAIESVERKMKTLEDNGDDYDHPYDPDLDPRNA